MPVTGTRKQRALLELFTRYECLPTTYIHRLIGKEYAKDLITLLNTEGYIQIARPSTRRLDARNKEALWEITPKGERLLGLPCVHEGDHFQHKAHRTVIQFSFDIACDDIPDLKKRTVADILAHPKCPPRPEANPSSFTIGDYTIVPDAELFGLEYRGKYFYAQGFEADGGTETRTPATEKSYRKKNITKMVRAYDQYLAGRLYSERYGISNMSILIIAKTETDMRSIMDVVKREATRKEKFAFKWIPDFTESFPPPTGHMVTDDWERVGAPPLNIMEILNGRAKARTDSPAQSRAG